LPLSIAALSYNSDPYVFVDMIESNAAFGGAVANKLAIVASEIMVHVSLT